jgi:hypothetical protein
MTPHNRRASSERLASVRSEPDIVLTASCPTRQVVLSTDSLACNRRLVYRGVKQKLTATGVSAISLARAERQEMGRARVVTRPMGPALPNTHDDGRNSPPVAISPDVAPDTAATITTTPFGLSGGR